MKEKLGENKTPLVSIVIPNYNYARFLEDAIESALAQTYSHLEIIVVDDGSSDNSRDIIQKYVDKGLVKGVLKSNGGVASAMNAGYAESSGDIVIFLDSDDILKPQAVETVVRNFRPGVSKVQWRLEGIDAEKRSLGKFFPPKNAKLLDVNAREVANRWFRFVSSPQSGNAYARAFLEIAMPLPESDWRVCADYPLYAAAVFYGDIVALPDVLAYYRLHGDNVTGLKVEPPGKILERNRLLRKYLHDRFPEYIKNLADEGYDEIKFRLVNDLVASDSEKMSYLQRAKEGLRGSYESLFFPCFTSELKRLGAFIWFLCVGLLPRTLARRVVLAVYKT
mgnify:CR=1 FL=1